MPETTDHLYGARGAVTGADECLQGVARKIDPATGFVAARPELLVAWAQAAALTAIAHALISLVELEITGGGEAE